MKTGKGRRRNSQLHESSRKWMKMEVRKGERERAAVEEDTYPLPSTWYACRFYCKSVERDDTKSQL
jgi:hypothetical protein